MRNETQNDSGQIQQVTVPGSGSAGVGSVVVALLSCALSLAALAVSIANLYTLLRLIRVLAPVMTVAQ